MYTSFIYKNLCKEVLLGKKKLAVLLDPDKADKSLMKVILSAAEKKLFDYLFIGGSLITKGDMEQCIRYFKGRIPLPVIIFPGSHLHISPDADAILFLSLISGRNPELLIGQQVAAAPLLKKSGIEVISTGYMLIDGGKPTSVAYMSNTPPIPADKPDIAVSTAIAGEMMGMKFVYMDAGSGALNPVSEKFIRHVRKNISVPLIIGGGIRTAEQAYMSCKTGADVVVVGNVFEEDPLMISEMSDAVHAAQATAVKK